MDVLIKAEEDTAGNRSASPPPGRESREDWRSLNNRAELAGEVTRSRSRSPIGGGKDRKRRGEGWGASGSSNTSSGDPHMQRARLFVGNIEPNRTKRGDLHRLFSRYGEVLGVSIHKGYAFVQMDRERNANKAANYEDNQMFMGSRIHVELSQAALKAGAKFERLPARPITPPPPPIPAPPLPSREREELALLEIEREREERLARILQMEKELASLRSREDAYESFSRRPAADLSPYDRGTSEAYHRRSPPLPPREYYTARSRNEPGYRQEERGRSYYERAMERELHVDRPVERSFERPLQRSTSPGIPPRDPISYPLPGSSRSQLHSKYGERRESPSSLYGMPQRTGSQLPSVPVGYGNSTSKPSASRETGVPPPGWPSSDYDKVSANRPPFAGGTPWS